MKQLFRRRSRSAQSQDRRKKFLRGDVSRRTLRCEHLEDRALMASDMFVSDHWNYRQPLDVNSDRIVTPLDALLVINELNGRGPRQLSAAAPSLAMSA